MHTFAYCALPQLRYLTIRLSESTQYAKVSDWNVIQYLLAFQLKLQVFWGDHNNNGKEWTFSIGNFMVIKALKCSILNKMLQ